MIARYGLPEAPPNEKPWQQRANCRGVDPDLFYPERGASTREAKAVCGGCEVRSSASSTGSTTPKVRIWGGLSERERRRLRGADAPGASRRRFGLTLSPSPPADLPPVLRSGSTQRPAGLRWWRRAAALHASNASSRAELGRGHEADHSTRSSRPRGLDQRRTSVPADTIPVALGLPGSSTPGPARATRGAGRRPTPICRRRALRNPAALPAGPAPHRRRPCRSHGHRTRGRPTPPPRPGGGCGGRRRWADTRRACAAGFGQPPAPQVGPP